MENLKTCHSKDIVRIPNGDDKKMEEEGLWRQEDQSRRAFIAKEEDIKVEKDTRRAIAAQQDELQRGYLSLLLQQTTSAMGAIQGQVSILCSALYFIFFLGMNIFF
jgi:hypothetical protein